MGLFLPLLLLLALTQGAVVQYALHSSATTTWTLAPQNNSYSIPASVPGCAHLDLLAAGLIAEPNNGFSAALQRWIASENFTYTARFTAPPALAAAPHLYLVLRGVDTAAALALNGVALPPTANMHRTHLLPLPPGLLLPNATNTLRVAFTGPVPASLARQAQCEGSSAGGACSFGNCTCPAPWPGPAPAPLLINAYLRKPQQDWSWDFAPATGTSGLREAPQLWGFASAALRQGAVVSTALAGGAWDVNVTVRIASGASRSGTLAAAVLGLPGAAAAAQVALTPGAAGAHATLRLSLPATGPHAPALWWPAGYGAPALYTLALNFTSAEGEASAHAPLRIGFRTLALEQPPAPNGGHLFRLRANGQVMHVRGSNWVPPTSLPHRPGGERLLARHIAAAAQGHMNMLRVWGGGEYAPRAFMEAADAAGFVVFQDAMLGDQFYNTQREFLADIGAEIEDVMFDIGHHASLGVLCGSNEMASGYSDGHHFPPTAMPFYSALYFDTVLANFSALLPTTPLLSSTPSNGNETAAAPWSSSAQIVERGDIHFYALDSDCLNASLYPRARWVTEHGWQSQPSFLTLAPTLQGVGDYAFNSSMMVGRQQHPPGQAQMTQQVARNWGWPHVAPAPRAAPPPTLLLRTARYRRLSGQALALAATATASTLTTAAATAAALQPFLQQLSSPASPAAPAATVFRDELHMTQVAAGQCLSVAIERWRSYADDFSAPGGGTAGILYWQMAEPWAGPSWSTVELGGRLKAGHYFAARSFAPVLVTGVLLPQAQAQAQQSSSGPNGTLLAIDLSLTTYDPALLPAPGATGAVELTAYAWAGGVLGTLRLPALPLPLPHTTARLATLALEEVLAGTRCPAPQDCLLGIAAVEEGGGGRRLAGNTVLLTPPRAFVAGLKDPGLAIVSVVPASGGAGGLDTSFNVTVTSALLPVPVVWLETALEGAWSDNALMLLESPLVLRFTAVEAVEAAALAASLAVSSLYDVYGSG